MEFGVESAMLWGTGVLTMPELCAANWDFLKKVKNNSM